MGGCMGQWVVSGQMTSLIKPELIDIIRFCLKIYDLWRHPNLWVDGWVNGWPHVKSLKSNKFWPNWDNSIMDILDFFGHSFWRHFKSLKSNKSWPNWDNSIMDILEFFWTFYLNHLSPSWGYFFVFWFFLKKFLQKLSEKPICHHGWVKIFLTCLQTNSTHLWCPDNCYWILHLRDFSTRLSLSCNSFHGWCYNLCHRHYNTS